jgi:hypothetical protein
MSKKKPKPLPRGRPRRIRRPLTLVVRPQLSLQRNRKTLPVSFRKRIKQFFKPINQFLIENNTEKHNQLLSEKGLTSF